MDVFLTEAIKGRSFWRGNRLGNSLFWLCFASTSSISSNESEEDAGDGGIKSSFSFRESGGSGVG